MEREIKKLAEQPIDWWRVCKTYWFHKNMTKSWEMATKASHPINFNSVVMSHLLLTWTDVLGMRISHNCKRLKETRWILDKRSSFCLYIILLQWINARNVQDMLKRLKKNEGTYITPSGGVYIKMVGRRSKIAYFLIPLNFTTNNQSLSSSFLSFISQFHADFIFTWNRRTVWEPSWNQWTTNQL